MSVGVQHAASLYHFEGAPRFVCNVADTAVRSYPHRIANRRIPSALILRLESGSYMVDVADERLRLAAGDVLVIAPECEHSIHIPEPKPVRVAWAHVLYTTGDGIDLFRLLDIPHAFRGRRAASIGECLRALASCGTQPEASPFRAIREQEVGMRLLRYLMSCARPSHSPLAEAGAQRLAPVLRFIEQHLSGRFTRAQLAQLAHLSESRFHDVFSVAMGQAPMEYVTQRRMGLAKRLLMNTDLSVAQIALRAGFEDACYFTRLFGRTQGRSPTAFRREARRAGL